MHLKIQNRDFLINYVRGGKFRFLKTKELDSGLGIKLRGSGLLIKMHDHIKTKALKYCEI